MSGRISTKGTLFPMTHRIPGGRGGGNESLSDGFRTASVSELGSRLGSRSSRRRGYRQVSSHDQQSSAIMSKRFVKTNSGTWHQASCEQIRRKNQANFAGTQVSTISKMVSKYPTTERCGHCLIFAKIVAINGENVDNEGDDKNDENNEENERDEGSEDGEDNEGDKDNGSGEGDEDNEDGKDSEDDENNEDNDDDSWFSSLLNLNMTDVESERDRETVDISSLLDSPANIAVYEFVRKL